MLSKRNQSYHESLDPTTIYRSQKVMSARAYIWGCMDQWRMADQAQLRTV